MMNSMFKLGGVAVSMPAVLSLLWCARLCMRCIEYMVEQGQKQGVMLQEYRNARAVQQVLIPENAPDIPGYAIQSVYKPYGEVGGDFFQIMPMAEGGVMVVIGDVSGKGMPAAMMVSLAGGDAANAGALHAESGRDDGGDESAIDWKKQWRIYDVPGVARGSGWNVDDGECRAHFAVSCGQGTGAGDGAAAGDCVVAGL